LKKVKTSKHVELKFDDEHLMIFEEGEGGIILVSYTFPVKDWFGLFDGKETILFHIHKKWIPMLIKGLKEFEEKSND